MVFWTGLEVAGIGRRMLPGQRLLAEKAQQQFAVAATQSSGRRLKGILSSMDIMITRKTIFT